MRRATIAILNWNGGEFVEPCIESVLHQSESDVEVIVVDNNSSDGSADTIACLLEASPVAHTVVRLDENRGICGGLQAALDLASGQYFFPFASDDVMLPDRVQKQCDQLDAAGLQTHIGAGAVALIHSDGTPICNWRKKRVVLRPPQTNGVDLRQEIGFSLSIPPAPGLVFRTDALRSIGGYDLTAPVEDVDTYSRLVLLGGSYVASSDSVVSLYRRHGSNASRNTTLMGDGLAHTLNTLVESGVDFGPVRDRWIEYINARERGYESPWGRLIGTLNSQPLDRCQVRSAGREVLLSQMSSGRRVRAVAAMLAPAVAARWIGRLND